MRLEARASFPVEAGDEAKLGVREGLVAPREGLGSVARVRSIVFRVFEAVREVGYRTCLSWLTVLFIPEGTKTRSARETQLKLCQIAHT